MYRLHSCVVRWRRVPVHLVQALEETFGRVEGELWLLEKGQAQI